MPLGPIIGALAASVATAGGAALGSKLFGGGKGSSGATASDSFANINAGGLTSSVTGAGDGRTIGLKSSALRSGLVGKIAATFPDQARLLAGLRASVAPGMSALRASRLAELENARRAATGDLRDNLARRRVLGSSFAQDSLTRSDLAFAQQKDAVEAESFLQELQLTQQLTQAEFEARRGEFHTALDELNLQADAATQLAAGATSQLGANARLKADLDAKAAAGAGQFFGQVFAPVGDAVGKAVTSFFTPKTAAA